MLSTRSGIIKNAKGPSFTQKKLSKMKQETKNCQNCKKDFIIESDDFSFYEKIQVPPPTFCPECRLVRRLVTRNERTLYKRKCDLCEEEKF